MNANTVIVDSKSGKLVENTDKPFILALRPGENLFAGILQCAEAAKIKSASISGLGGLSNIEAAFYRLEAQTYETKLFAEMHELISLNGNITIFEGKLFLHIHIAFSDENYQAFGGHLMNATVNPAAEITIIPLAHEIERKHDSVTGLKILCPIK